MSVLSRQKAESAAVVEKTENLLSQGVGNKARERIAAPVPRNGRSVPRVRKVKVLGIKQQLAKGTYDLDEHEDAILDRLLEDLTT